jgi:DMSO/TMAO reductase YedYZ molybdopterin-dependent catalytic subunit
MLIVTETYRMDAILAPTPPLLNEEAPLGALAEPLTPTEDFYQRTNFLVPEIDRAAWTLSVHGAVRTPLVLGWDDLRRLPARTLAVTLECAGNGRTRMTPLPPGHPWELGAVSTARFTGASLRDVLRRAGVEDGAVEVAFAGADAGITETGRYARFERSLPLDAALDADVLLAWGMNGAPLPPRHGHPLRLVVPGWYGVASVKWLTEVRVLDAPFDGFFQRERYVYRGEAGMQDGTPVTRMRVRALIARPEDGERLKVGAQAEIRGTAWSGEGPVRRVEVSVDGGATWRDARLGAAEGGYACVPWTLAWTPARPGRHELLARATDGAGNTQPLEPVWNELGYGNNVVQRVAVDVEVTPPRG